MIVYKGEVMASLNAEGKGIIEILTRLYHDIREIEDAYSLRVGGSDFRTRIDYFHDAVRALVSGSPEARLSVEMLAYDVSAMRYVQAMPLSPLQANAAPPAREIRPSPTTGLPAAPAPTRAVKQRLKELYQHYALLFSALLKPYADEDYHAREDELNHDVGELAAVKQKLEAYASGKGTLAALTQAVNHLEDSEMRQMIDALLRKKAGKPELKKAAEALKARMGGKDKEIAAIGKAHLNYGMAQLGIYEEGKDTVKSMAMRGMNLAGQFVENAMRQAAREMGR